MNATEKKKKLKQKRKMRVRSKISGDATRPRLSVFRSARHLYAQVIDDQAGRTLASVSSFEKGNHMVANVETCKKLGKVIAERCAGKSIGAVTFDKNGNRYHGRIKAFADGAREGGLVF